MMMKKFALLLMAAMFVSCTAAPPAAVVPAAPEVKVPETPKTVPGRAADGVMPALENPASWTMVIVPDTQTYIKQIENQGILDLMLSWIVRRRAEMNIQQVLFTGDLTYGNDTSSVVQEKGVRFTPKGRLNDLVAHEQWQAFSRLMERLDGEVPYILCTGNHDYGRRTAESRKCRLNEYFPTDRNTLTRRQLIGCAPNAFNDITLENAAYEFTAPHPDNRKFLVISLQFSPTDEILAWAKQVADRQEFADHIGIVLTHSYLHRSGARISKEKYRISNNCGEQIFQKLVYPAKNIRLVVCGHIAKPDNWEYHLGFSIDKNCVGKSVAQMAFNAQAIGGGFSGNGGDGWLRLLEFMPDGKTVKARTFSPFFAASPATGHLAWKEDARNCFTFVIE